MNSKEFAAMAIQIAASASVPPTTAAHMQMVQFLSILEALAQGHMAIVPVAQPTAQPAAKPAAPPAKKPAVKSALLGTVATPPALEQKAPTPKRNRHGRKS